MTMEQLEQDNERLGQELDRWQLVARDLLELLAEFYPEGFSEWEYGIYQELKAMPEMRIRDDVTLWDGVSA